MFRLSLSILQTVTLKSFSIELATPEIYKMNIQLTLGPVAQSV
jgi:hypothetical protein